MQGYFITAQTGPPNSMEQEQRLEEMENSIERIDGKMDEVLDCLKGGGLIGVGLVAKVNELEKTVQDMKNERLTERTEVAFYKGMIKWFAAAITLMSLAYMFNQFFNKH
jgi:hypothetical protein